MLSIRTLIRGLGAAGLALLPATSAPAGDLVGLDAVTSELLLVDTVTSTASTIGAVSGGPASGFAAIDRAPDGGLYGVAPGFFSGYGVYVIDEQTRTASLVAAVSTSCKGEVGIAVDPSGGSVWVAGYVGLSFLVELQEVDLTTGAATPRGTLVGGVAGLAFDGVGELFTTLAGATASELVRIDRTDAARSVPVGPLVGVDASEGLDLSSAVTSGAIHVLSRGADVVHSIDTTTGAGTEVGGPIAGGGSIHSIADVAACAPPVTLGAGCPGTGGFVPELSWSGCAEPSAVVRIEIAGALGGSSALLLIGAGEADVPVGDGCSLFLSGVAPAGPIVPLGGALPGTGAVAIAAPLPATTSSGTFTIQAFVADPARSTGFSATNGIRVTAP